MAQAIQHSPSRMVSLNVALPLDTRNVLIERAETERRSLGSLVRAAVDAYLSDSHQEETQP